jgi:hypothetical protein
MGMAVHFMALNCIGKTFHWHGYGFLPYHYRTSVYGQLIRPLCHKLWMKPVVMHQNGKGKHLETEINDIYARIH